MPNSIKKNIIIVGYPKSGTTWLSKLIAELVACPLQGDWGYEDLKPLWADGLTRVSEYQCFKSHHTHDEIKSISELPIHKIVYLMRDPRDIVISGMHFFNFSHFKKPVLSKKIFGLIHRIDKKITSKKQKKKQMISAVLYGAPLINRWLKTPWEAHYDGYKNTGILCIKYEDLLVSTTKETLKIMSYLNIDLTEEQIKDRIKKQSFEKQKEQASVKNNQDLKKRIRKGSSGYWKKEFTKTEIGLFKDNISTDQYKF